MKKSAEHEEKCRKMNKSGEKGLQNKDFFYPHAI